MFSLESTDHIDTGVPPGAGGSFAAHRHAAPPRLEAGHARGFWYVAVAFAMLMAFGTAPTPLWPLYEARDGFGSTTVTVAFALLVLGASISFICLGHLSDRLGRRRVIVAALGAAIVAALILTWWTSLSGLLVGRFLNGLGIGLMASTATAYLHDLHERWHPERANATLPGVVATLANLGGLALGPLVAGVVAQWAGHPLIVTQAGFAVAMAVCLVLSLTTPETVQPAPDAADRPARFALRPGGRAAFGSAAALAVFSFAMFGLVTSLGAIMLVTRLGITSHMAAGLASFLMFGSSAVAQLVLGRLSPRRMSVVGAILLPVGLLLVTVSLYRPALWLFLVAVAIAGAGAGLLFKSGVASAAAAAQSRSRAGVLAMYFVAGYLGMGVPAILFSVVSRHTGIGPAMIGFAVVLSLGTAVSVAIGRSAQIRERGAGGA